jgi:hypothetical protein
MDKGQQFFQNKISVLLSITPPPLVIRFSGRSILHLSIFSGMYRHQEYGFDMPFRPEIAYYFRDGHFWQILSIINQQNRTSFRQDRGR